MGITQTLPKEKMTQYERLSLFLAGIALFLAIASPVVTYFGWILNSKLLEIELG